jgi:MoaA/NifB/PqqE/SkfB family radical SAM enzyme
MAISLDGPDAASHDGFRRVEGSFARTMFGLEYARQIGLATQINTTRYPPQSRPDRRNRRAGSRLRRPVVERVLSGGHWHGVRISGAFRRGIRRGISFLYNLSKTAPFDIKTTKAQHYRRYVAQQRKAEGAAGQRVSPPSEVIQRQAGINDGKGFVFVLHTGEIYPSGFLPVSAGNVRPKFPNRCLPRLALIPHAPGRR